MDLNYDYHNYYVALIIITIVTIAISIALSFYFIFIPASRIETQAESLRSSGLNTIANLNRLINSDTQLAQEILEDSCNSIIYIANTLFGSPHMNQTQGCILDLYC